jgi:hypothetical protein
MESVAGEIASGKPKARKSHKSTEMITGVGLLALSVPMGPAGALFRLSGSILVGDVVRKTTLEYIERRAAKASMKINQSRWDRMYAFLGKDTVLSRISKHGISLAFGALAAVGSFLLAEILAEKFMAYAYASGTPVCHPPFGSHPVVCPPGTPPGLLCAVHPMHPNTFFYYECPPPHIPPPHVPPPPPPPPPPSSVPIS